MILIRWTIPLTLFGVLGCSGDPDGAVRLVPVRGTITLNGKPMANAAVSFVPEPGNPSSTAGGDTTGPEGNYLARYRNRSGLSPGKYKVLVTPGLASDTSANVSDAFKDDPFMAGEGSRVSTARKPAAKALEIKGEFDAEVAPKGSTLDFDVKSTTAAASSTSAPAKK